MRWEESHARDVLAARLCEIDNHRWDPVFAESSSVVWRNLSDKERDLWRKRAGLVKQALLGSEDSFRMMVIADLLGGRADVSAHPEGFLVKNTEPDPFP